jgi:hypothetical protein
MPPMQNSARFARAIAIAAALLKTPHAVRRAAIADWLQWGGPKRIWTRPLGEGHSAILAPQQSTKRP